MDKESHIRNLVYKYISNQCDVREQDELLHHLKTPAGKWVFDEIMTAEADKIFTKREDIEPAVSSRLLGRLQESMLPEDIPTEHKQPFYRSRPFVWMAALVLIVALVVGYWLFVR